MKNKIGFILVFSVIILNSGNCQQHIKLTENQEKQITELFSDYADSLNIKTSLTLLKKNFPGVEERISKIIKTDSTFEIKVNHLLSELKKENNRLKKNYEITDSINNFKKQLKNNLFTDSTSFSTNIDSIYNYCFSKVNNSKNVDDTIKKGFQDNLLIYKSYILKEYKKIISKNETGSDSKGKLPPGGGNKYLNEAKIKQLITDEINNEHSKFRPFLLLALCLGSICFIFWIIFLILRIRNTDEKGISLNTKKYISNKVDLLKTSINDLSNAFRKIENFESKIIKLNDSLESLKNEIQQKQDLKDDEQSKEVEFTVKPPRVVETYYLQFPDPNGFFWDEKKSRGQQNDTPYILEIDQDNPNKGDLSFITNKPELIRNAIASAKDFLKPVCTIQGNTLGDKIETIEKGKLERKNDKWQIMNDKKLVIRIYS